MSRPEEGKVFLRVNDSKELGLSGEGGRKIMWIKTTSYGHTVRRTPTRFDMVPVQGQGRFWGVDHAPPPSKGVTTTDAHAVWWVPEFCVVTKLDNELFTGSTAPPGLGAGYHGKLFSPYCTLTQFDTWASKFGNNFHHGKGWFLRLDCRITPRRSLRRVAVLYSWSSGAFISLKL